MGKMEFKNIKQLKKEIGCGKRVMYQDRENTTKFFTCGKKKKCYNCELKEVEFQTLKQVCEEIEKIRIKRIYTIDDGTDYLGINHRLLYDMKVAIDELLKKFQGD